MTNPTHGKEKHQIENIERKHQSLDGRERNTWKNGRILMTGMEKYRWQNENTYGRKRKIYMM